MDPASGSSGWALFEGPKYVRSGTVAVNKKKKFDKRLQDVYSRYQELDFEPLDEVHVEDVPRSRKCHIYVHYSIGVILSALAERTAVSKVDIPVNSWQKYVDWERENKESPVDCKEPKLKKYRGAASRDEQAAISMGLWYLSENS